MQNSFVCIVECSLLPKHTFFTDSQVPPSLDSPVTSMHTPQAHLLFLLTACLDLYKHPRVESSQISLSTVPSEVTSSNLMACHSLDDKTIRPSNPTTGYIPCENHNSKRVMYHNVHCSSIYNSQDMEAT